MRVSNVGHVSKDLYREPLVATILPRSGYIKAPAFHSKAYSSPCLPQQASVYNRRNLSNTVVFNKLIANREFGINLTCQIQQVKMVYLLTYLIASFFINIAATFIYPNGGSYVSQKTHSNPSHSRLQTPIWGSICSKCHQLEQCYCESDMAPKYN